MPSSKNPNAQPVRIDSLRVTLSKTPCATNDSGRRRMKTNEITLLPNISFKNPTFALWKKKQTDRKKLAR